MKNIIQKVLVLGASGQIARHVIDQLADKPGVTQTLFARQPEKITQPHPANSRIIMGDVLNPAALEQAMVGQDVVYANLTGEDLDLQAKAVIAAMKAAGVRRLIFVLSLGIYDEVPENSASGITPLLANLSGHSAVRLMRLKPPVWIIPSCDRPG